MSLRDHALRIAVLDVIGDEVAATYKAARKGAEVAFAPARAGGQPQQNAVLPDGTEIGLVSIKAGVRQVDVSEADLEAWTAEHVPDGIEEYIDERAANSAEVLDVLRAVFPELVKKRIRTATRAALLKEIEKSGGWLTDKATGDKVKVGDVTDLKPTGAFSYRPGEDARDEVIAAWQSGELRSLGLGALALPGAVADPDEPQADESPAAGKPTFGPPFCDEHGFRDPVLAAAHALMVQSGFTTPPIEAYRMVRDGGVARERALAWMAEVGLDPADPREGKDTPWPLPEAGEAA
jgi:hypothetical protein